MQPTLIEAIEALAVYVMDQYRGHEVVTVTIRDHEVQRIIPTSIKTHDMHSVIKTVTEGIYEVRGNKSLLHPQKLKDITLTFKGTGGDTRQLRVETDDLSSFYVD